MSVTPAFLGLHVSGQVLLASDDPACKILGALPGAPYARQQSSVPPLPLPDA